MKSNPYATQANAMANLTSLRKGAMLEEVAEAMSTATEQVKITKKKAKVVITLTIEPADKKAQDVDRVWVSDEIKVVAPPRPKKDTLLFVEPDKGVLTERDPQLSFIVGARPVEREPEQQARAVDKDAAAGEARSLAG